MESGMPQIRSICESTTKTAIKIYHKCGAPHLFKVGIEYAVHHILFNLKELP
jgi:hypothetical protein